MKLTTTEISVHKEDHNPIFGEIVTRVKLRDEGGGFFVNLIQINDHGEQVIRLDFNEIDLIVKAINILKEGADEQI
jgi:hypothetical protein